MSDGENLPKDDAPFSKIFALPLRLGRVTETEAPIFDRNGDLVCQCVDCDCEERALAFIRAVNSPVTVLELEAGIRVLRLSLEHERERRADLLASLKEISEMFMGRPDMVKALQPLIGFGEKATFERAAAAIAKAAGGL